MFKAFLATLFLAAAFAILIMYSQDEIIFPVDAVPAAGPLPPGSERLQVKTSGDETLHGVHIQPRTSASEPRTLILGFGGNAWNGEDVASYLHWLYPDAHIVAFHYRGYRPSSGKPSADALLEDAPLVFDAAVKRAQPERTVAVGFSIGSGIAASLANRRPLNGLVLVTPFDSLKAVASSLYPWLPIGPFFQHEIDTVSALRGSRLPVAILAAGRDEIIPPPRTEVLRPQVPNLVYDRTIAAAGHNDIYEQEDFQRGMQEALAALSK